jgi:anti-anti-sigma factor
LQLKDVRELKIITIKKVPELACTEQSKQLKNMIVQILENSSGIHSIVINLKKLDFLNSSIVGILLYGQRAAKEKNIEFALMNVDPNIMNMFELASIAEKFKFYENESELNL